MVTFNGKETVDVFNGTDGSGFIDGNGGNDTLSGNGGVDVIDGGEGNDTITGGTGADVLSGGIGNDTFNVDAIDGDQISGGTGIDTVNFSGSAASASLIANSNGIVALTDGHGTMSMTGVERLVFSDYTYVLDPQKNNNPYAANEARTITEDQAGVTGNVLTNDFDWDVADRGRLTVIPSTLQTQWGTVSIAANGTYTFTQSTAAQALAQGETAPAINVNYTVRDTSGAQDTATLSLTLQGRNDAPTAVTDNGVTGEDSFAPVRGNVLTNDSDVDHGGVVSMKLATGSQPQTMVGDYGTLVLSADGSYEYVRNATDLNDLRLGESVVDRFTYAVKDQYGATSNGQVAITVQGATDDYVKNGTSGDDTLSGQEGNDTLSGLAGNDLLLGEDGNDTLDGGYGSDVLWGGKGDDTLVDRIGAEMHGGDGNDTLTITGGPATGSSADDLYGDGGNDTLIANAGNDYLDGGDGNDVLYGDDVTGINSGYGAEGDDTLIGGAGDDTLYGGNWADNLNGGDGNDRLFGGWGIDVLVGGAGDDYMDGGHIGTSYLGDTVDYRADTQGVTVDLNGNYAFGVAIGNDTIVNVRDLWGGSGNDVLLGDAADNDFFGYAGNDRLFGADGVDRLDGGAGDDVLAGGTGADFFLFGIGGGHDTITDFSAGDVIGLQPGSGVATALQTLLTDTGNDTLLTLADGSSLLITGVDISQLNGSNVLFV